MTKIENLEAPVEITPQPQVAPPDPFDLEMRLWPVKLPKPDGRTNKWNRSLAEAAERAMTKRTRVRANMSLDARTIERWIRKYADFPKPIRIHAVGFLAA